MLDALAAYHARGHTAFTPPGHKHARGVDPRVLAVLGEDVFTHDLLSSSGLDDRASTNGYLSTAQDLMADAIGADGALFSTCGSSLSVKAAMLAAGGAGHLVAGRDAHKSIASGLVLSGQTVRWAPPVWDADLKVAHPPSPETIAELLDRGHTDAVLVTSPTPYGTCADLDAIVEICHAARVPVCVDEAWGAHLPWHDELPTWAMAAGADIAVVSVHKAGGGLEQGSVIAYQGDLIDPARLAACADLLSTTSANVLIYAAMDGWRRQMVEHGHTLLSASLDLAARTAGRIERLPGLHVEFEEFCAAEASADIDPHVITIDVSGLGITGYTAADWLRAHHQVDMGLSDHRRVCAQLTYADGPDTTDILVAALRALTAAELPTRTVDVELPTEPGDLILEQVITPREAFFADYADVPVDEAAGRICAEQITPYPPGIPAALPGERLTHPVLGYLRSGLAAGMVIPDVADTSLETVRVVTP